MRTSEQGGRYPFFRTGPYEQGSAHATIRFAYHPESAVPYALTQHSDKDVAGAIRAKGENTEDATLCSVKG